MGRSGQYKEAIKDETIQRDGEEDRMIQGLERR